MGFNCLAQSELPTLMTPNISATTHLSPTASIVKIILSASMSSHDFEKWKLQSTNTPVPPWRGVHGTCNVLLNAPVPSLQPFAVHGVARAFSVGKR